jgi:DNA-binding beta-propeller fold protein YncE
VIASTGVITTVVGTGTPCSSSTALCGDNGPATAAQLNTPAGITMDRAGNLYIADNHNHRVRKVISPTNIITTVAGTGLSGFSGDNGKAPLAQLQNPVGVVVDEMGNLYIADAINHRIRKINHKVFLPIILKGE